MRYLILSLLLIFSASLLANPIPMYEELISEIYMHNGDWSLELSPYGLTLAAGDSLSISNQRETIKFPILQNLIYPQCMVISSEQYPLYINPDGATLSIGWYLHQYNFWGLDYFNFTFTSDYPNNCLPGQSLVQHYAILYGMDYGNFYWAVEATPTIGTHIYEVTSSGTVTGSVKDRNLQPVPNAIVRRAYYNPIIQNTTNVFGHYELPGLEGFSQYIEVKIGSTIYADTLVNIIPTQTVSQDFVLSNYSVSNHDPHEDNIAPVMISANPLHAGSEIKFALGNTITKDFILKIYNIKGEAISELNTTQSTDEISLKLPANIASGVYLYQLGNGYKTFTKGKFTIIE